MSAVASEPSTHPLLREIRAVRASARRLRGWHLLLRLILTAAAAFAIAAVTDYVVRPRLIAARGALSSAIIVACVLVVLRGRRRLQAIPGADVPLARQLETLLPGPRAELAAAVEFLSTTRSDGGAGSTRLRIAVVNRCWETVRALDLRALVDRQSLRPWLLATAAVVVGAAVGGGLFPAYARSAWLRLAAPWQMQRWPQRHSLEFVDPPARIAAGSEVRWVVVDQHGRLPDRVELELREEGGEVRRIPMTLSADRATAISADVRRSFHFRAQGGDDDSLPWRRVEVVESPRLTHWRLTVLATDAATPPKVTLPPVQLRRGARLRLDGQCGVGVVSVRVRSGETVIAGEVNSNGDFHLPAEGEWAPTESAAWALEAVDAAGVVGRQAVLQVDLVENRPPQIEWTAPIAGDAVSVQGRVLLRGVITDDVRVRQVRVLSEVDVTPPAEIELLDSPANKERLELDVAVPASRWADGPLPRSLGLRLVAEDDEGDISQTPVRVIQLVSADEMQERLLREVADWADRLAEVVNDQRSLRNEAAGVNESPPRLSPGLEAKQRQLATRLTDPAEGLLPRLRRGLQTWEDNQLESRPVIDAWRSAKDDLTAVATSALPAASDALAEIGKLSDDHASWPAQASAVSATQDDLVKLLERILASVTGESRSLHLERDFVRLGRNQRSLGARTEELHLLSLTTTVDERELRRLAAEQLELAREADRLHQAVLAASEQAPEDPRWKEVAEICRRQTLGVRMREAAANLAEADRALQLQTDIGAGIDEIVQSLRGDAAATSETMDAHERRLTTLAEWVRRQGIALEEWRAKIDDAAAAKAFALSEAALAAEIERESGAWIGRAEQGSRNRVAEAAELLQRAGRAATERSVREAFTQGIAGEAALQDAKRALITEIDRLRQEAVRKEAARLAELVRGFIARQERLVTRTTRQRTSADDLSRVALAEIQELAAEQATLANEVGAAGANSLPLYRLVLLEAARAATQAARQLDQRDPGVETLRQQQDALSTLRQLLRALDDDSATNDTQEDSQTSPPGPEDERPAAVHSAAELRLILERQQNVLKQISAAARRLATDARELRDAGVEIAPQQARLADVIEGWARERGDPVKAAPPPLADDAREEWNQRVNNAFLEGEDLGAEKSSVFSRLAERMRVAESGLTAGKFDEPMSRLQRTLIRDLETLVAAAGKSRKNQGPKSVAGQGGKSTQNGGEPTGAAANDSTGRKPSSAAPVFEPGRMEHLLRSVWGHLPEKTRDDLRQTTAEEFLPEYERLIIDYYRRLADETPGAP